MILVVRSGGNGTCISTRRHRLITAMAQFQMKISSRQLVAEGLAGVVVTDHHGIDVARIRHLQELAADRLAVFPGIELRSRTWRGTEFVHYVGIFPDDSDLDDLWSKIQGHLELLPRMWLTKGDDRVYVPFTQGAKRYSTNLVA